MKKILLLLALTTILFSCSTKKKAEGQQPSTQSVSSTGEKDGSSFEKAIVINEKSESKGVDAEYAWLRQNYPGYHMERQSLTFNNGKSYDILKIKTAEGKKKDVYFDISNFFGKF
jgi:hypothetical protein